MKQWNFRMKKLWSKTLKILINELKRPAHKWKISQKSGLYYSKVCNTGNLEIFNRKNYQNLYKTTSSCSESALRVKTVVQPKKLIFTKVKKSSNEMNIPSKIYNPIWNLTKTNVLTIMLKQNWMKEKMIILQKITKPTKIIYKQF